MLFNPLPLPTPGILGGKKTSKRPVLTLKFGALNIRPGGKEWYPRVARSGGVFNVKRGRQGRTRNPILNIQNSTG